MNETLYLLRDEKTFNKLCQKINKDFRCQDLYMCNVCCPLWIAREVELAMNEKKMSMGEAYRSSTRASLSDEEKRKILKAIFEERRRDEEERRRRHKK